jgi:branched-chain amino acid transport system permease protein
MVLLQLLINGVLLGGLYLLMAQGLNIVFGVMRVVNFAHGIFIAAAGLITVSLYRTGINPFVGIPVAFVGLGIVGALTQRLLLDRITTTGIEYELTTLLVTFGLGYILINAAQEIWGTIDLSVPYLQGSIVIGSLRFASALVIGCALALAFAAALYAWLNRTRSGQSVRATAQSGVGAEICGIDTHRTKMLAFALGAGSAGVAGSLLVLSQPVSPQNAEQYTILSFVVIALGGLGDYLGAAVGALIMGVAQTLTAYYLSAVYAAAVPPFLLVLVMLLRPAGLLSLLPGARHRNLSAAL